MRFTSPTARPSLTPLGYRLLQLSETKLADLDASVGGRDDGIALWKEVVVRQAVRSAWESVERGSVGDLTDWSSKGAMGLDVIGEEEEEEVPVEGREQRWFDDLVTSLGDDEYVDEGALEWAESSVETPFDDGEYDDEGMEAYTWPSIISPPLAPSPAPSPIHGPLSIPTVPPSVPDAHVDISIVAVEPEDDRHALMPYTASWYEKGPKPYIRLRRPGDDFKPIQPILVPLVSPTTSDSDGDASSAYDASWKSTFVDDLDECIDDFMLPPPLHRSLSTDSTTTNGSDDACVTPLQSSCEELEESVGDEEVDEDLECSLHPGLKGEDVCLGCEVRERIKGKERAEQPSGWQSVKGKEREAPSSGWLDLVVDKLECLDC